MSEKCATIWIILWFILGLAVAISICFYGSSSVTHVIKYDCRLSEISVDYPQQVKEQCRNLMK